MNKNESLIKMKRYAFIFVMASLMMGCTHKATENNAPVALPPRDPAPVGKTVAMIPKATAFKMNGDYADHVGITLGQDGEVTYFPAPSDISSASKPLNLGNGWWLNRQGLGKNSVFLKYTFEEYSRLKETPTVAELKKNIIAGSHIENFVQLPYNINDAKDHLKEIKSFLVKDVPVAIGYQ